MSQINNPSGASHLVDSLKAAGVEIIFCITGAGNLAIIDAILTDGSIKLIILIMSKQLLWKLRDTLEFLGKSVSL